jgi:hypothetical protein
MFGLKPHRSKPRTFSVFEYFGHTPEEPVRSHQLRPLDRALENVELVPKSQDFNLKGGAAAQAIPRRSQNGA